MVHRQIRHNVFIVLLPHQKKRKRDDRNNNKVTIATDTGRASSGTGKHMSTKYMI